MKKKAAVAFVSAEAAPFSQTGGLGDVIPALAEAFVREGVPVTVFLPFYRKNAGLKAGRLPGAFCADESVSAEKTFFYSLSRNGVEYIFVKSPGIFTDGEYGDGNGAYADNCRRFSLFCRSVAGYLTECGRPFDIVHCHDWQTGLIPALLKRRRFPVKTVFTIHNLAYQGEFDDNFIAYTGLRKEDFSFKNRCGVNFMRAALKAADKITTVSPTYAREILESGNGCGMEDLLRSRGDCFCGILNGIDVSEWNPERDDFLPYPYSPSDFSGKSQNKAFFMEENGLKNPQRPLFVMISRLARQKGIEALYGENGAVERILNQFDLNLAVIGTGEPDAEKKIRELSERYENFSGTVAFSSRLSHLAEAAGDFFLMPSLYEPCGLNQLYSLRYGTIPLVTATGGLADTVCTDTDLSVRTGIRIPGNSADDIVAAVAEAMRLYADGPGAVDAVRRNGMGRDFSWRSSCLKYLTFYHSRHSEE